MIVGSTIILYMVSTSHSGARLINQRHHSLLTSATNTYKPILSPFINTCYHPLGNYKCATNCRTPASKMVHSKSQVEHEMEEASKQNNLRERDTLYMEHSSKTIVVSLQGLVSESVRAGPGRGQREPGCGRAQRPTSAVSLPHALNVCTQETPTNYLILFPTDYIILGYS